MFITYKNHLTKIGFVSCIEYGTYGRNGGLAVELSKAKFAAKGIAKFDSRGKVDDKDDLSANKSLDNGLRLSMLVAE